MFNLILNEEMQIKTIRVKKIFLIIVFCSSKDKEKIKLLLLDVIR